MTPEAFKAAVDRTALGTAGRSMAHAVLVKGWSQQATADAAGVTIGRVNHVVARVARVAGLERLTVYATAEQAERIRELVGGG